MDISYWNKLSPTVKFCNTTKQYFGKYLWRLVIYAEGGRLLESNKKTLEEALESRIAINKSYNYAGSWWNQRNTNLDKVNLELLRSVQQIKVNFGDKIRMRTEEPHIQFYAEDEAMLKSIASMLENTACIESINSPKNAEAERLLMSGVIIRRGPIDYKYKVIFRDGRYTSTIKQQVLSYLDNLGDEIKLSKTSRDMLTKTYASMWGVFFYTNDPKLVTFINLIDPKLISNIHLIVNDTE